MTKMKYDQPLLIPLNYTEVGHGKIKCKVGSAAGGNCKNGPSAQNDCDQGQTALRKCKFGSSVINGKCKVGGNLA